MDCMYSDEPPDRTDEALDEKLTAACAEAEMRGLLIALDGRFVPPGPGARLAEGVSMSCPPGAISTASIRAPCRRERPGRLAGAQPKPCWCAMPRTTVNGRAGSCSTSGVVPQCGPAATTSRRPSPCSASGPGGTSIPTAWGASISCRWQS